jgi:hypothetical protein
MDLRSFVETCTEQAGHELTRCLTYYIAIWGCIVIFACSLVLFIGFVSVTVWVIAKVGAWILDGCPQD